MFTNCTNCTKCTNCVNLEEKQNPPGLKGHTLVSGRNGIIIYGGVYMSKLNMTLADLISAKKRNFTAACQPIIN